ncbi:uncharacterized protein BO96DRAFT_479426 [Aspergillus niger CBS 101883]|uniref:uncharacterized protein n=1 Tax=Aspergillus lacticoffeatus (strain CBS 101883) TaxID=1450533 RepID=UPI000D7F2B01|nr:uncharacterized protein BO96DRAFT_479426 [Aspergillus niger CBS 101883]PYH61619.1 hypothetical protein BO96DRAFT_479426 [Aspergillus niger CBS 101883]
MFPRAWTSRLTVIRNGWRRVVVRAICQTTNSEVELELRLAGARARSLRGSGAVLFFPLLTKWTRLLALVWFALAIKLDDHGCQGHEWILSLALARETAKERASWEKADHPMGKSVTKITVPRMYPAPVRVLLKLESLRYALPAHEFSFFLRVKPVLGPAGADAASALLTINLLQQGIGVSQLGKNKHSRWSDDAWVETRPTHNRNGRDKSLLHSIFYRIGYTYMKASTASGRTRAQPLHERRLTAPSQPEDGSTEGCSRRIPVERDKERTAGPGHLNSSSSSFCSDQQGVHLRDGCTIEFPCLMPACPRKLYNLPTPPFLSLRSLVPSTMSRSLDSQSVHPHPLQSSSPRSSLRECGGDTET